MMDIQPVDDSSRVSKGDGRMREEERVVMNRRPKGFRLDQVCPKSAWLPIEAQGIS